MRPSAAWQEIERIVKQIRAAWPEVKIVLRGDSGFCRNELMSWCESNGVDFVFGWRAIRGCAESSDSRCMKPPCSGSRPANRRACSPSSNTSTKKTKKGGWDRERRVVAKAEHIDGKENPRFVVTSLTR